MLFVLSKLNWYVVVAVAVANDLMPLPLSCDWLLAANRSNDDWLIVDCRSSMKLFQQVPIVHSTFYNKLTLDLGGLQPVSNSGVDDSTDQPHKLIYASQISLTLFIN